jgi:hypothetical protein
MSLANSPKSVGQYPVDGQNRYIGLRRDSPVFGLLRQSAMECRTTRHHQDFRIGGQRASHSAASHDDPLLCRLVANRTR